MKDKRLIEVTGGNPNYKVDNTPLNEVQQKIADVLNMGMGIDHKYGPAYSLAWYGVKKKSGQPDVMMVGEAARLIALDVVSWKKSKDKLHTYKGKYGYWFRPDDVSRFKTYWDLVSLGVTQ